MCRLRRIDCCVEIVLKNSFLVDTYIFLGLYQFSERVLNQLTVIVTVSNLGPEINSLFAVVSYDCGRKKSTEYHIVCTPKISRRQRDTGYGTCTFTCLTQEVRGDNS